MSRSFHPRKRTPPKRLCRECGTHVYSWTESPLCPTCVRAVTPREQGETLREFRQRVIDPERNNRADS